MFIDKAKINVAAGRGGNGYIGFYRAKYVPDGGPDGGDGGNGGSVVFVAETGLNNLVDFRYKKMFAAANGGNGEGGNRAGKGGADAVVRVPVGTVIRSAANGRVIADMNRPGEPRVIAKGGRGGRGNQHFAKPTRQAPKFAEDGRPGQAFELELELKLIADAGIIGLPNAGKSTLLSMVTNAKPKIADYQFTTLSPNLGVVRGNWGSDFVLADIPGLIEGASDGRGLGHEFLRHIERTKVLVHVVDASLAEPTEAIETINRELSRYNPGLLSRPQIIAANKTDLPDAVNNLNAIEKFCAQNNFKLFAISAATNTGLSELMRGVADTLLNYPESINFEEIFEENPEPVAADEKITVGKDSPHVFRVEGPGVERILGYTNMENEKGFAFFQRYMREKGVIARLEELGIEEGDTVNVYELQFEYYP
ncbi:MAG: GTPase ObgE [Defluviitaleaceae bacterium]|nr:GTPase ObgE [Defluviitaleaceae bacterium]